MSVRVLRLLPVCLTIAFTGCEESTFVDLPPATSIGHGADQRADGTAVGRIRIRDEITLATWNLQVFGQGKLRKPQAMSVIVDVIRRFDVVAIQEVRSQDQSVLTTLENLINEDGSQYELVIGPRIGRSSSKEQYVYIYDTTRIELIPGSVFTVGDPRDRLHREPLVAGFRWLPDSAW